MKKLVKRILRDSFYTILSIYRILRCSKYSNVSGIEKSQCVILGNGPSLKKNLQENINKYHNITRICVNNMALDENYEILRPEYYIFADPIYVSEIVSREFSETRLALIEAILGKTKWDMVLFIPATRGNKTDAFNKLNKNNYIRISYYNNVPINGFKKFKYFCFKHNLGNPLFQNVLISAIYLAINLKFKKIYLLGADHSWTQDIFINDQNILVHATKHFDDNKQPELKPAFKDNEHKITFKMHEFMFAMYRTFEQYHVLNDYAKYLGVEIYNSTEDSYIDAFERVRL